MFTVLFKSLLRFHGHYTSTTSMLSNTVRKFSTNSTNSSGLHRLGKLNHIAIAVPNLERSIQFYRDTLGAVVSEITPLHDHGVSTVFVNLGNTKIELLHPLGDKSPIAKFLETKPEGGMHHICIEVKNIKSAIENISATIRTLTDEPKIGAHGRPVIFLHPKDCGGVLIELEEE